MTKFTPERFNSDYIDGMIVRGKRGDYKKKQENFGYIKLQLLFLSQIKSDYHLENNSKQILCLCMKIDSTLSYIFKKKTASNKKIITTRSVWDGTKNCPSDKNTHFSYTQKRFPLSNGHLCKSRHLIMKTPCVCQVTRLVVLSIQVFQRLPFT